MAAEDRHMKPSWRTPLFWSGFAWGMSTSLLITGGAALITALLMKG
jgi:hypothetical protein